MSRNTCILPCVSDFYTSFRGPKGYRPTETCIFILFQSFIHIRTANSRISYDSQILYRQGDYLLYRQVWPSRRDACEKAVRLTSATPVLSEFECKRRMNLEPLREDRAQALSRPAFSAAVPMLDLRDGCRPRWLSERVAALVGLARGLLTFQH